MSLNKKYITKSHANNKLRNVMQRIIYLQSRNLQYYFVMGSPGLVMWDLWWTKWCWGRLSPSTSVSPANLHSTNCSVGTYHTCLANAKQPSYRK
jgi:hypothetical protein